MSSSPSVSNSNQTFTVEPSDNLSSSTTYKIRVTTGVKDSSGNYLSSQYETSSGFTTTGGEFSVAFNPVISQIHCEINTSNPSHLTVWAEVNDDGPLEDLRYLWYFSKLGFFGYAFESETTNPTVLYGYSASTTSGTLKVWVTDGEGLGTTSVFERTIAPGSC